METALENLSKEDLLRVVSDRDQQIRSLHRDSCKKDERIGALSSQNARLQQERDYLKAQVEMLKRIIA